MTFRPTLLAIAVCCCLLIISSSPVFAFETYYDFPGPYCETSRSGCCLGRQDNCTAPIAGMISIPFRIVYILTRGLYRDIINCYVLYQVLFATAMKCATEKKTVIAVQTMLHFALTRPVL